MQEPVTLDCSFTVVLPGLNTQPYTDGSSTKEGLALLLMMIYREINSYIIIHYIKSIKLTYKKMRRIVRVKKKKKKKERKKRKQTKTEVICLSIKPQRQD